MAGSRANRAIVDAPPTYSHSPSGLIASDVGSARPESLPYGAALGISEQAPDPDGPENVSPVMHPLYVRRPVRGSRAKRVTPLELRP